MSELKPCPFCGGTKICTEKGINLNYCDNCSAESNVEHWNNRPIEDALNRRIAELEAAQHWIPVEERLPEDWTMVLFTNGVIRGIGQFDKEGFYDYWCEHSFDKPVTHWMPLPNLPEVNNG